MSRKYNPDHYHNSSNPLLRLLEKRRTDVILRGLHIHSTDAVLDIGCGAGNMLERINAVRTGIDLSTTMLERSRTKLSNDVTLLKMSADRLTFADASFDTIICSEVLEHLLHPRDVLQEIKRVLRPGGMVAISVPNEDLIEQTKRTLRRWGLGFLMRNDGQTNLDETENEWHVQRASIGQFLEWNRDIFTVMRIVPIPFPGLPVRFVFFLRAEGAGPQEKQSAWAWQWHRYHDDQQWLFFEWIAPCTLETFRGKDVLDCGCGGGQHIAIVADTARSVTGVDLNALESARINLRDKKNVTLIEDDIATMQLGKTFDVVYSIGVLHHTDDPDAAFRNMTKHCRPGGKVIVWVYSSEGNALNRWIVEPAKTLLIRHLPRSVVAGLAHLLTILVSIPVWTLYLLPLPALPYYQYFQNWRRLSYRRNHLNVFDKLNAPQTQFITRERIGQWFSPAIFTDVHISGYKGVSWRGSGTLRPSL